MKKPLAHKLGIALAFGLGALTFALPDLYYHHRVFGHWLKTESTEWFLLSANNISHSFWSVLESGILRREELGFVLPFALLGGKALWKHHRWTTAMLASGLGAVLIFHLCYAALRPRDLIAILPLLYLCAAYGLTHVWIRLEKSTLCPRIVGLVCCLLLLSARSTRSLELPWRTDVITFGYVSHSQLEAFYKLGNMLPPNAIVASMLNGGAIELYSGRQAVHPAAWTKDELLRWSRELAARDLPFYVLDDGEEMTDVLTHLSAQEQLAYVMQLTVPYFAYGGGNLPKQGTLYRLVAPP